MWEGSTLGPFLRKGTVRHIQSKTTHPKQLKGLYMSKDLNKVLQHPV